MKSRYRHGWLPVIVGLLLLGGCAVNPVTGKNELSIISVGEEIAIGEEQYARSQQSQGGEYRADPELTAYVNRVGQRVAAVSDSPLPYEFVVLDNSTPNAWALPGGKIAVNRGLLMELRSEAELAAVLGHEVVHAAARHGAKAMQRGMLLQGVLLATTIAAGDREYGNYIVGGAALGAQLVSLRYGRDAEREADYYGMKYLAEAGYDPRAAVSLQETFVRLAEGRSASRFERLFASHPPSAERVANNRVTAAGLAAGGELGVASYREATGLLRRRAPAYEAAGAAARAVAADDWERAEASLDEAIALAPDEARFYGSKADIHRQQKRLRSAVSLYDRAIALDPDFFAFHLGRGLAHKALGRMERAQADLAASNDLLPTALAAHGLGEIALSKGDATSAKRYFRSAAAAKGRIGEEAAAAYARLDLTDNPSAYFAVAAGPDDKGALVVQVRSAAPVHAVDIVVEVALGSADRTVSPRFRVDRLAPEETVAVNTGVTLASDVEVLGARVVAAAASPVGE